MKALRFVMVAGMLAAGPVCPGIEPDAGSGAQGSYSGDQTYQYLQGVGRVRTQINEANKERIPGLIHGQDPGMLEDQASRIDMYRQDLSRLPTDGVDPEAVQFTQNFMAILDAYKSVCVDTAELYQEAARDDAGQGSTAVMSAIKDGLPAVQADTIGAVVALASTIDKLDPAVKEHAANLDPIVAKVSDDKERLVAAKSAHHSFTLQAKQDFAQRYPKNDWDSKDVLP